MKSIILNIYKTFFTVRIINPVVFEIMNHFTHRLTHYDWVYNKRFRRMVRGDSTEYFQFSEKERMYRFTYGLLKNFMLQLGSLGVTKDEIEINYINPKNVQPLDAKLNKTFKPRDYQISYCRAILETPNLYISLIDAATGVGKMQPLDALIKVPGGWKKMGDIKVGDEVVTPDGGKTKVVSIHPHGYKKLYRVTFYDGRSCECGDDHLWLVNNHEYSRLRNANGDTLLSLDDPRSWRICTTAYLRDRIPAIYQPNNDNPSRRYYIPLVEPEKIPDRDFIIHPYILGCILGDGCISSGNINLTISSIEVINKIKSLLPDTMKIGRFIEPGEKKCYNLSLVGVVKGKNPYLKELERYNLKYKLSIEKFIPIEYLDSSEEQRWELLRGLIDTDGYIGKPKLGRNGKIGKSGTITYATSSKKLSDGFVYLVRSLGGIATTYIKLPTYTYNGIKLNGKVSFVTIVRLRQPDKCVTRSFRKERVKTENQYSSRLKLLIKTIKFSRVAKAQCIKLEDPRGLYITNDFIVTHNTFISMLTVTKLNKRTAILVLPKYVDKWIDDIKKYTDAGVDDVFVVKGSSSIEKLAKMKPSEIKYKFFILSMATMREYISAYEEGKLNPEFLKPENFMEHLGVGVLLNDETHQHFHALLKISLYMNVEKLIGMTATLDSNRESMKKIYNTMFPPNFRISNLVQKDNYVNVEASAYRLVHTKGIRYQTARGYNHIEYEHHILKHFKFLKSYLEMIKYYVQTRYVDHRQNSDKALVYVSSVRMSSALTTYLQEQFPSLTVRRFMEDDPYENIIESDICVTSAQNGGTAFDVPNLVYVLMTTSMASLQANLQTLGRLREIKGRELWYTYIYCLDIKNQVNMHKARRDAIKFTTKQFKYTDYIKVVEN